MIDETGSSVMMLGWDAEHCIFAFRGCIRAGKIGEETRLSKCSS